MRATRWVLSGSTVLGMCIGLGLPGVAALPVAAPSDMVGLTAWPTSASSKALHPAKAYDFNGDGYADLPVGVPGEDVGRVRDAGAGQCDLWLGSRADGARRPDLDPAQPRCARQGGARRSIRIGPGLRGLRR